MTRPWSLDDALHLSDRGFTDAQIARYYGITPADCGYRIATGQMARNRGSEQGARTVRPCGACGNPFPMRRNQLWGDCCRYSVVREREMALI